MEFKNRAMVERAKAMYPAGTRIKLIEMGDDPCPVEEGTTGTVVCVDDAGQLQVAWDNGRSLALIPGIDRFTVIGKEVVG